VAKAKKQERVYEDAIEQLQAEQDALEVENAKLRKGQGADRQGEHCLHACIVGWLMTWGIGNASTTSAGEGLLTGTIGGLESSQLAEQVS
jgi:dynactin 1